MFVGLSIIHSQGIFLVFGYLISLIFLYNFDRLKFWNNFIFYNLFIIIGLISGSITYPLVFDNFNGNYFKHNSLLLSLTSIFIIYCISVLFKSETLKNLLDIIIIPFILLVAFGKIGCYYGGCCYGIIVIDHTMIPLQLLESFFYFIIFLYLKIFKKDSFILFIILFSIFRLFFEIYREDSIKYLFGIKITVILSSILFLSSLLMFILKNIFFIQQVEIKQLNFNK